MHNIKSTNMLLPVNDDTSPAHVTPAGDHDNVAGVELDVVGDLALLEIELNCVVHLYERIGVTDGSAVVCDDMGDTTGTDGNSTDFQELVVGLLGGDAVNGKTAFDVVKETEVLARFFN